jgi:predicted ATPase/DNA-binding CsgD family transcriptional regulator
MPPPYRQTGGVAERHALIDAGVSEREAEVLELVAERATNAEIAARLFVSVRTVESHVSSLLRKLDVPDRRALARLAHSFGPVARIDERPDGARSDGAAGRPDDATGPVLAPRSVPVPLTSFVGRSAEVAGLVAAVEAHRLVTALGPGGVGKTRLATAVAGEVADRWRDGVWFVDLVPVTDEALVPAAVSRTLGLADSPGRSSEDHVLAHLADRECLLVLDNCEHMVAGVGVFVERLLGTCPGVTVLATSQARLMLPFESVFTVPGLSLPSEGDEGDAVTLFLERAGQAGAPALPSSDRARIGEICRRLDGSALAIELAAARLPALGLDGIERGLAERFDLLSGGSRIDERHQSLRSTIDWSYGLLGPADQALLRRVSVFAAPFTTEAAAEVAGDSDGLGVLGPDRQPAVEAGLARLTEHSLLLTAPGERTRHRVLDSIRQYGLARMAEEPAPAGADGGDGDGKPDELAVVRRRHHAWATTEVEALDRRADVPLGEALGLTGEFAAWRDDFDRVADDARAALLWVHHADLRAETFAMAEVLASACFTRGLLGESQRRYEQAAEHAPSPAVAANVLIEAAGAASSRHVGNDALRLWRSAAATARDGGDTGTAAYALARAAELLLRGPGIIADKPPEGTHRELLEEARSLGTDDPRALAAIRTAVAFDLDEVDPAALAAAKRAVAEAEALDDDILTSAALDSLTAVKLGLGDLDGAIVASRRRMDIVAGLRASAMSAFEVGDGYHMASEVSLAAGDFARARRYAEMSDHVSFHSEEGHLATSRLLKVDALAGELERVLENAERFRQGWIDAGRPIASNLSGGSYSVAMTHGLRGDDAARQEWVDITHSLGVDDERLEGCLTGFAPTLDAIVALHRGEVDAALARLAVDPAEFQTWYTGEWRTWYAAFYVEAAALAGSSDVRDRIARARTIALPNPTVNAMLDRAEALLDGDAERVAAVAAALEGAGCRYQWARTLVLAGGALAERGRREMAALGAAPMAELAAG